MAKSPCPVTQAQFMEKAEPLKVVINGQEMLAEVKAFSTGSFGWNINGKMTITVDGKPLSVQIGMNLTVVGSKDAARGAGRARTPRPLPPPPPLRCAARPRPTRGRPSPPADPRTSRHR